MEANEQKSENSRNSSSAVPVSTESSNYHLKPADYPSLEVDNIYALLAKILAERLLSSFLDNVHTSLPILRQDLFIDSQQYRSRLGVSHSQFSGSRDFTFDQDIDVTALPSESGDTENVQLVESSIRGGHPHVGRYSRPGKPKSRLNG
jgi:hypothetical protein